MTMSGSAPGWTPSFLDYLYTAFTNATAIGPTDAMPLTPWAKSLMASQSFTSLLTLVIVVSRAVSTLNFNYDEGPAVDAHESCVAKGVESSSHWLMGRRAIACRR